MEILSAVLCREAKQTGPRDWNIAGEFDRVLLESFPSEFGPVTVMVNWRLEPNEEGQPLQVVIADHLGNAIAPVITATASDPEERADQVTTGVVPATWESIAFESPGNYRALIRMGAEIVWEKDFRVDRIRMG